MTWMEWRSIIVTFIVQRLRLLRIVQNIVLRTRVQYNILLQKN